MRAIRYFLMMVPVSIVSLATPEARAAKCALCQPNRDIYSLFPEATSYRTVDGRVDEDTRKSIEGSLGRKLAFSDLGKTSMCVVFKDKAPLGFVHARSEIGRYGAIQLVWAIDLDLRVKELWVRRSREKDTARLRRARFRNKILGKGWRELRSYLTKSGAASTPSPTRATRKLIEEKALISGIKTLLILERAFGSTLRRARLLGKVHSFFPGTVKVDGIRDPLGDNALAVVEKELGSRPTLVDKESFTALRSVDRTGSTQGIVILTNRGNDMTGPEVWWSVSPDGRIREALVRCKVSKEVRESLASLRGLRLKNLRFKLESSKVVRYAAEVLAVLPAHDVVSRD